MAFVADDLVRKVNNSLTELYQTQLAEQLDVEIKHMTQIASCIQDFYALPKTKRTAHTALAEFRATLLAYTDKIWPKPELYPIEEVYPDFWNNLNVVLDELPKYASEEQKPERFHVTPDDKTFVKILKVGKNLWFSFSSWPNGIANWFRKEKKTKPYWMHDIPLRNLAKKHFLIPVLTELGQVADLYYATIAAQYLRLKNWEEQLAADETSADPLDLSTLSEFKEHLMKEVSHRMAALTGPCTDKFLLEYDQAGTIELPESLLTDHQVSGKIDAAKKDWSTRDQEWRNTTFALFDEWRLDLHIYLLRDNTLASLNDFQSNQFKKIYDHIGPELDEINTFVKEGLQSIGKKHESIQKEFKRLNYQAVKKLDKEVVPQLCEKLSNQTIINLINKLEVNISHLVEELSDERTIVKTDTYNNPLGEDELHKISPYELITFEMLPRFKKRIDSIKQGSLASLHKTTENVKDLDHVITFSLSSAIAMLDHQSNEQEAISIAEEGLKRAAARLEEERHSLNESMVSCAEELETAVNQFCEDILELTFNENIRELRLRVTKAKATQHAKEVRERIEKKMSTRKKRILLFALSLYNDIRHQVNAWSDRFVLTAKKPEISKQVSDFLLESQQAIEKLPLIYKRLYQIEPLEDLELFEGRQDELLTLKKAFESWQTGHFSATAVLGEKWSGLTSFLTYATHKHNFSFSINRWVVKDNGYNQAHFIQLMQTLFKVDRFESIKDVIHHLNDSPKRVVILEDIQNLYQRKVDGFEAMQLLFQIINKTYKNVFWVVSANIYTWSYLKKTININEYFSYIIELKALTNDQIINVIWKRNKISGFKILFEVDKQLTEDKKFNKLEPAQQQLSLKKKFFAELNVFAQSNISLALIYWLLSTKEVDESTITIGAFKKPNLNFLTVLAMDKLYALHALILHDGLSDRQLAEILNATEKGSELTLLALLEDGILVRDDDKYMVNPIVYRNTISLLKSKNLIH